MLTMGEYLANPYGRGSNMAPMTMIRESVERALRTDYPEPIKFKAYKTDHTLIFHCRMPSRTKAGIFYDIVIELDYDSVEDGSRIGVAKLPFRVFSNSPSFYYTYAKVFQENELFCDWLKRKYERKIMRKDPKVRNPANIIGYERTIYTCMYLVQRKFQNRPARVIYQDAEYLKSYRDLIPNIHTQEEIEIAYERAPYTEAVQKKKDEIAARKKEREEKRAQAPQPQHKPKNATPSSPTTKASPKTPKTKKMSFIQKIRKLRH